MGKNRMSNMLTRLLDTIFMVKTESESVEVIKDEMKQAQVEAVQSIQKLNKILIRRNVTVDIHIATGGRTA